jgi:hypothetical protein
MSVPSTPIPALLTQPSSVTLTANTTISGIIMIATVPGSTRSVPINLDLLAGQVITDVPTIATLVALSIVAP